MKKERESDIQAAICDYLTYKKVFFWRNNNVPIFAEGRFRAMPKYARKGIPDIIAILSGGRFLGIEVKRPKGVLSDAQKAFLNDCEAVGGRYLLAYSVDDVVNYFNDWISPSDRLNGGAST